MNQKNEEIQALLPLEVVDLVRKKPEVATLLLMNLMVMMNNLLQTNLTYDQMSYVIYDQLVETETSGRVEQYPEEIN